MLSNVLIVPFDGRSDYDGFIRAGIPAGGIATGAEAVKTKEEEEMFGGHAGQWLDPCYHQICDDLGNLNHTAWEVNTKVSFFRTTVINFEFLTLANYYTQLIAHSVATYALSFEGFPKREQESKISSYSETIKQHGPKAIM